MSKSRIVILTIIAAFAVVILLQLQTAAGLRRELAAVSEENARLRQLTAQEQDSSSSSFLVVSPPEEKPGEPQQKRLEELESEVMRLRGVAGHATRAEAEVAQLKSALESRQLPTPASVPDANSNAFITYLGEAVPPPSNIDPAYSKEGLLRLW